MKSRIPTPPKLTNSQRANFITLKSAWENDDVALLSVVRKSDSKQKALVCILQRCDNASVNMIPIAELFDINRDPFEEYFDPTV